METKNNAHWIEVDIYLLDILFLKAKCQEVGKQISGALLTITKHSFQKLCCPFYQKGTNETNNHPPRTTQSNSSRMYKANRQQEGYLRDDWDGSLRPGCA